MKRTTTCLGMLLLASLAIAACGRAVDDISPVQAMNLENGEVKTFASEGEVPPGWGVCPDSGCTQEPPPGVPCQNLGVELCTKDPACRLRTLGCSSPGSPPSQGGSSGSGSADAAEPMPVPMPPEPKDDPIAPPPEPVCEQVCVAKDSFTCEELSDQQACADRSDCQWAQGPCPAMPCASDGTGCDVACPATCQTKGPQPCQALDQKSCSARTDCKWELSVCPAIACADPDDPTCVVECQAFCQPDDDVKPPPSGDCFDNSQCGDGQYCYLEQGCTAWATDTDSGSSDEEPGFAAPEKPQNLGVCKERPDNCNMMYGPVCGCDGKTYGNDCIAAGAGVNVAHPGECGQPPPPPPPSGDCFDSSQCGEDEFCFISEGCGFDQADPMPGGGAAPPAPMGTGLCTERPDGCYEIYAPVCGCDGKSYGNDCMAASAGANIAHLGKCDSTTPPPEPACVTTGCSGEICASEQMESDCSWKPEYDCLKLTQCGAFGVNGSCGWKKTTDYVNCVAQAQTP